MLAFGLLTIQNVHRGRRRVLPQHMDDRRSRNRKKTVVQLIRMMLVQSFLIGSTTTTFSIVNRRATAPAQQLARAESGKLLNSSSSRELELLNQLILRELQLSNCGPYIVFRRLYKVASLLDSSSS